MSSGTFQIRNAHILTQDRDRRVLDGTLTVRSGRIIDVGETPPSFEGPIIDFEGDYLLPGLVQTHVHLCQTLFRHHAEGLPLLRWLSERIWPFEAALDESSLEISVKLGIGELLLGGTTCLLDMGTVHHQDVTSRVIFESGIRAACGKAMMDTGNGVPARLRETTRDSLDESLDLAREWHGADSDRIRYAFAPRFVLSCTPELQREVGRLSREAGYLIHTHASEHPSEIAAIDASTGRRNIDLLQDLGMCSGRSVFAHGVHLSAAERQILASTATTICHCPTSNLKLGSGVADIVTLIAEGINVGIGADGAPCNNTLDAFQEMRLALLLQSWRHGPSRLDPQTVLDMATRNGATALGWDEKIGSLETGKDADLVRISRSDFRLGHSGDACVTLVTAGERHLVRDVWVRGEQLVRNRALVRYDHQELLSLGEEAARRTLSEARKIV